jgi:hypothetical protein
LPVAPALRGRDAAGAAGGDALLKLSKEAMRVVHNAVCEYLVKCWRRRAEWYGGGVPLRGADGAITVEMNIWDSMRSLRRTG